MEEYFITFNEGRSCVIQSGKKINGECWITHLGHGETGGIMHYGSLNYTRSIFITNEKVFKKYLILFNLTSI
jgi:hypothetical protein